MGKWCHLVYKEFKRRRSGVPGRGRTVGHTDGGALAS